MKKNINYYIIMILAIACLTLLGNTQFGFLSFIEFSPKFHIAIETVSSLLLLLIFLTSNKLYSKTNDERFLILGYGFLAGLLFNLVHIFTMKVFPYDNLFFNNIENNPTLVYLIFCNLILPLSIYVALIWKSTLFVETKDKVKSKILNTYLYAFLVLAVSPVLFYYFLPQFLHQIYIIMHALEYVNYALYLMVASILINSKINSNQPFLNKFVGGLLVLGLGGLFYINPLLLPINSISAHIFQILGFLLILLGLSELPNLSSSLRVKDYFVAYLSLLLIAFYIVFVPIISGSLKIIIPQSAGYIFIECLLFFQLIIYAFSTISWNKIANKYLAAERDRTLIRVFESMRRTSNPNIIKNIIVNEINNSFHPDECFIVIYNQETNSFYYDKYLKDLPSKTLGNFEDLDKDAAEFEQFQNTFNNIGISFSNINEYIERCSLKGTPQENLLKEYNIKSIFSIPINYNDKLLGYLILQYKYEYKDFSEDEILFLTKMAAQIGIIMNK